MILRGLDPRRRCGRIPMVDLKSLIGIACVAGAVAAASAGATAQIVEGLFPFLAPASPAVTTSPPPYPLPQTGGGRGGAAPRWSGQTGQSRHSLMGHGGVR